MNATHATAARWRRRAAVCATFPIALAILGASATAVSAQDAAEVETDPFHRNTMGVEFGFGALGEAWNLNAGREWLVDGTASVWWAFRTGVAVVIEFHNIRVLQETDNAFVQGFSPLVRWRMRERHTWRLYGEVGPGISWSDLTVPPRGTRFNYLFQAGTGVQRRLGRNSDLVVGLRFLHLSNNGREGRGRNPDIEAVGGQLGISVRF
jgi:Lipid A 3-O-deacylase (PagL)